MNTDLPPAIEPDQEDWTWVVGEECPESGFDGSVVEATEATETLREVADTWGRLLGAGDEVGVRTVPQRWSVLEYGCHVRDVCRLYLERLDLMLDHDGPTFADWDHHETATTDRYDLADPHIVAAELEESARMLADRFETAEGDQWSRTGFRSDGAAFTIETFARYFIHDPIHHLHDVG